MDSKFVTECDFDYNEKIDIFDIVKLTGNYGKTCKNHILSYENYYTYTSYGNPIITIFDYNYTYRPNTATCSYLYKDFGDGYFSDFTHQMVVRVEDPSIQDDEVWTFWRLSNVTKCDGGPPWYWNNDTSVYARFADYGNDRLYICDRYAGKSTCSNDFIFELGKMYYITIRKSGTNVCMEIYNSSKKTTDNLEGNLTLILDANHTYRYLYPASSHYIGTSNLWDVNQWNLTIGNT
jgi:hypothetical protein